MAALGIEQSGREVRPYLFCIILYTFLAIPRVLFCVICVPYHDLFWFLNSMKRAGRTVTKTLIRDIAFTQGEIFVFESGN